jgi:hypothetical protein
VRYTHVNFGTSRNYEVLDISMYEEYRERLGIRYKDGYYVLPNGHRVDMELDLRVYLSRFGLPAECSADALSSAERLSFAMFIADSHKPLYVDREAIAGFPFFSNELVSPPQLVVTLVSGGRFILPERSVERGFRLTVPVPFRRKSRDHLLMQTAAWRARKAAYLQMLHLELAAKELLPRRQGLILSKRLDELWRRSRSILHLHRQASRSHH